MSVSSEAILETLRRVPLFNELSKDELATIAANVSVSQYGAGQVVFSESEKGGDLLIVMQGSIRIVKLAKSGRQQLLAIERLGASLGEVSVFDGGPYSTTAIAIAPATLLRLRGQQFRNLCLAHPGVAVKVIRVLGHRLRKLRRLVEDLSFATVRDRLISYLLSLCAERGVRSSGGVEIYLDENNEELASRLGTVRELISRNLGRLHGDGLIVMSRRRVCIPDEALLRAELEG
jgi:CRP/FNR family transcriptional regulator